MGFIHARQTSIDQINFHFINYKSLGEGWSGVNVKKILFSHVRPPKCISDTFRKRICQCEQHVCSASTGLHRVSFHVEESTNGSTVEEVCEKT